jgi:hypothetical protein
VPQIQVADALDKQFHPCSAELRSDLPANYEIKRSIESCAGVDHYSTFTVLHCSIREVSFSVGTEAGYIRDSNIFPIQLFLTVGFHYYCFIKTEFLHCGQVNWQKT